MRLPYTEGAVKGRILISKADQVEQPLDNPGMHCLGHFFDAVIMPIDRPAFTRPLDSFPKWAGKSPIVCLSPFSEVAL